MNYRLPSTTVLLALLGTTAFAADVYRSTAPDGTVSYSDRPQGSDSQFVFSANTRPAAAPAAPAGNARAAANTTAQSAPQAPTDPTLPKGPSAATLREQRQKNCDTARETAARYEVSRRLFRTNAAGEREYLDDAAVAAARAKAAADVQDWCG
ncbi:MAG TPA: DUF4124 domain-containing protein [Gammaproteobacteria bacterium]|nr:DUF4124 domain-containing protein [Gammaproteobacteria bacterium]